MHYGRFSYTLLDPDTIKCSKRRRYVRWFARLWHATPSWANLGKIRAIYKERDRRRAGGQKVEVDHTVPLFHELVCGLHVDYNLEILSTKLNAWKSNKIWPDMPERTVEMFTDPMEPEQYALPLPESRK